MKPGMAKSKLSRDLCFAGVIFIFDNMVRTLTVARTTSMARSTRLARKAGMEPMSTDFLSRQVTLQIFLPVSRFFPFERICVQTSANVVHATVCKDRTHFLARHFIYAHALAQDELSSRVCFFLTKSPCRLMFHRNLLGVLDGLVEWLN